MAHVVDELAALGGDERARARELDLVRYQVGEIDGAALAGPDEDERLEAEEDLLADAAAHREPRRSGRSPPSAATAGASDGAASA